MWALRCTNRIKYGERPFEYFSSQECDPSLVCVPENFYEACIFFPAQSLDPDGSQPLDMRAWELANSLASDPAFQTAEWLAWINDSYQAQPGAPGWLNMDPVSKMFQGKPNTLDENQVKFALAYLFWKGIFYYFYQDDRWKTYNARFAYLVSAWQWFHLARYLSQLWLQARSTNQKNILIEGYVHWLNNDLIEATRVLQSLIQDPDFRYAVQLLVNRMDGNNREQQSQLNEGERLLYGMILEPAKAQPDDPARWMNDNPFRKIGGNSPIRLSFSDSSKVIDYGKVIHNPVVSRQPMQWEMNRLHPVFMVSEDWNLQSFVRLMIGSWMLPRYDFSGAFHLAMLLRSNDTGMAKTSPHPSSTHSQPGMRPSAINDWTIILGAIALCLIIGSPWFVQKLAKYPIGIPSISGLILLLMVLSFGSFIWRRLDHKVYQYLLLPRLLGGIVVGYIGLVLSADAIVLKNALFANCAQQTGFCELGIFLTIFLWVIVLLIGGWYFYYESLARVKDESIAKKRSFRLLIITAAASTLIGLFAVSLTTAMEWQADWCANIQVFRCPTQGWFFIGPIGLIDARQLFVFIPLAMLTGFISQFLFEDKPITSSVWESN